MASCPVFKGGIISITSSRSSNCPVSSPNGVTLTLRHGFRTRVGEWHVRSQANDLTSEFGGPEAPATSHLVSISEEGHASPLPQAPASHSPTANDLSDAGDGTPAPAPPSTGRKTATSTRKRKSSGNAAQCNSSGSSSQEQQGAALPIIALSTTAATGVEDASAASAPAARSPRSTGRGRKRQPPAAADPLISSAGGPDAVQPASREEEPAGAAPPPADGGDDAVSGATERPRVQDIKASIKAVLRAMRSATRVPTSDSVSLILAPVTSTSKIPAAPAPTGSSALRAEPLPPALVAAAAAGTSAGRRGGGATGRLLRPLGRRRAAAGAEADAGPAAAAPDAAELRGGRRGREAERRNVEDFGRGRRKGASGEPGGRDERDFRRGSAERDDRYLRGHYVERDESYGRGFGDREREYGRAVDSRQRSLWRHASGGLSRLDEEDQEWAEGTAHGRLASGAAAGPPQGLLKTREGRRGEDAAAERVAGALQREQQAAEAAWRQEPLERQQIVRRSNEDYVRYMEGLAESMAAADAAKSATPSWVQQQLQQEEQQQQAEQQQAEAEAVKQRALREAEAGKQRTPQEKADVLRGLAEMFRNFSRQAQPAAAAAAVVAAVAPVLGGGGGGGAVATAAPPAAAPAFRRGGGGGSWLSDGAPSWDDGPVGAFPLASGVKANDVRLILKPLSSSERIEQEDEVDDLSAEWEAAQEADDGRRPLRAQPLLTRSEMLRLMKPVQRARLPAELFMDGRRRWRQREARQLVSRDLAAPAAAGLGPDVVMPSPSLLRLFRKRSYMSRVVRARQMAAAATAATADVESGATATGEKKATVVAADAGQQPAAVDTAASHSLRSKYEISTRSFKVKRQLQYSDRVKSIVRRASLTVRPPQTDAEAQAEEAARRSSRGGGEAAKQQAAVSRAAADRAAAAADDDDDVQEEGQEGGRGEYNPAAEVANDVYQEVMGVRLPERAMYGKRAEALAAMTPQQVKAQARSWVEACGKEYALAFHAREPLLLTQPAQQLLLALETFSRVFNLPPDGCVRLALRWPMLLELPADQLTGTVEAVSEALEIGMGEAAKIVMQHPFLARRQPLEPVAERLELLGALLPVSRDKLRQMIRARPELLARSLQHLAAYMMNTSAALGLPLFDVSLMLAGCPNVHGVKAPRLASRLQALQLATSRHPLWRQQLATISPPSLGRCLVANEAAVARLQDIMDRGLGDVPDFSNFKKVLTMSSKRFESLIRNRERQARSDSAAGPAAIAAAKAPGAAAAHTSAGKEGAGSHSGSGAASGAPSAADVTAAVAAAAAAAATAEAAVGGPYSAKDKGAVASATAAA